MMILFLDFDGCLHPLMRRGLDFSRLPLLWEILCACPTVKVVFSTSWRTIYRPDEMLEFITLGGGEDLAHRVLGQTPIIKVGDGTECSRRDLEIEAWVAANGYAGPWLALDDQPELFNGGHQNLYVVDGSRGLTNEDVAAIIQLIVLKKEAQ